MVHAVDCWPRWPVPCLVAWLVLACLGVTVSVSVTHRVWFLGWGGSYLYAQPSLLSLVHKGPAVHASLAFSQHLLGESHEAAQSRICPVRRWPLHSMVPQFPYL